MSIFDRARALFRSPADRRLEDARAAAFEKAPRPLAPSTSMTLGGRHPSIDWFQEQPNPPPGQFSFTPNYSDHLYQQFSTPLDFEGFVLERIRNAVAQHRLGIFYESWALSVAIMGFAPVFAALGQAIAPILSQHRFIRGGSKGLARMVASEVEAQLVPRGGLLPSRYLEPQAWGTMAIYLRNMGFCVLQHVDGDPDPVTGVRPRFTRVWEPFAVRCNNSPLKWLAMTSEGEIEIKNDGKFTFVADSMRPHLTDAAILSLGDETLAGRMTQEARNAWIDRNGQIKWVATLPEKVATHGEAGDAFYAAVQGIAGPEGLGVFPFGSTFEAVALTRDTSGAFGDALRNAMAHIAMVYVGSPGPLAAGAEGVYQPKDGGKWDVRNDLIDRPTNAIVRGINQGHIAPYCDINYSEAIQRAKKAGAWEYPCLSIPLPDRERDARVASIVEREKARCEITTLRKTSGYEFSPDDANNLADDLELRRLTVAATRTVGAQSFGYDQENGVITIGQRLDELGKPIDDPERAAMTVPEYRAHLAAKQAEAEAKSAAENAPAKTPDPAQPDAPKEESTPA